MGVPVKTSKDIKYRKYGGTISFQLWYLFEVRQSRKLFFPFYFITLTLRLTFCDHWGGSDLGSTFRTFSSCFLFHCLLFLFSCGEVIKFRKHLHLTPTMKVIESSVEGFPILLPKNVGLAVRKKYYKHVPEEWNNPVCLLSSQKQSVRCCDQNIFIHYRNQICLNKYKLK